MKAVWLDNYSYTEEKTYKAPCCPECSSKWGEGIPILKYGDGYRCINCHKAPELDDEMKSWLDARSEMKTEVADCILGCGGKGTVEEKYRRDRITLEWRMSGSVCKCCGMKIVV